MLVCVLDVPSLSQIPDNMHERTVEDGPNMWAPASHVGDPKESSGFAPAQAWPLQPFGERTGRWKSDFSLSVSPSCSVTTFQANTYIHSPGFEKKIPNEELKNLTEN